ncbi:MAG: 23S rRNA (pseudouridine(1915)-N(3))-methyltransferase RlmH [Clostridiales bacterium]|nr:23S rRNA (pseudouridine(1915)-N(3))-methyltransferase RlmH [Clostridiales bacterium]
MNIQLICVGKLNERYWKEAVAEYQKRLSNYCTISIEEVKEARLTDSSSEAEEKVKDAEGKQIIRKLNRGAYVIALDVQGKQLSSEEFARKIEDLGIEGKSNIAFIIGGSIGLSKEVLDLADLRLSFSKMTFPHQMMRVIFLEQLYRAFKIMKNETYHK